MANIRVYPVKLKMIRTCYQYFEKYWLDNLVQNSVNFSTRSSNDTKFRSVALIAIFDPKKGAQPWTLVMSIVTCEFLDYLLHPYLSYERNKNIK